MNLKLIDFFAGAGLASQGLSMFDIVAATDIDQTKARVYRENHPAPFWTADVRDITPETVTAQQADVAWASFPCQDLSCAGHGAGFAGTRSSLVFDWLQLMTRVKPPVPALVLENVLGLLTSAGGANYVAVIRALAECGYAAGAVVLDAARFLPQSRPRVFIIAVLRRYARAMVASPHCLPTNEVPWLTTWCRPKVLVQAERPFTLSGHDVPPLRWTLPEPAPVFPSLSDFIDVNEPIDPVRSARIISLIPRRMIAATDRWVFARPRVWAAFRRTRDGKSVVELRTDGLAGALRTPKGGSSRQIVVIKQGRELSARYMTVRECARLMGLPDAYRLPQSEGDALTAIGDGVCVPVAAYLAEHLLQPVCRLCAR